MTGSAIIINMENKGKLCVYGKRYMKLFFHNFAEFLLQKIVIGLFLAIVILWQMIRRGLITVPAIKDNVLAVLLPYAYVILAFLIWHFCRTAYLLYLEDESEIEKLRGNAKATPDGKEYPLSTNGIVPW